MWKKKIYSYAKEGVFVLLFMTILANGLSLYKSQELNQAPLTKTSFKLIDNTKYKVDNSKPLLIHFWATWCPTCKLEAGNIQYLSKFYNVVTVAVNSGSDYDIYNYLKERNLNFKVVNDKDSELSHYFNIHAYPTTFIYNAKQDLVFSEVGYTSTIGLFLRMLWVKYVK